MKQIASEVVMIRMTPELKQLIEETTNNLPRKDFKNQSEVMRMALQIGCNVLTKTNKK